VHVRDYVNGISPAQAHRRTQPPVASLSPALARAYDVAEGQLVTLHNPLGSLQVRAPGDRGVAPDTIVLAQGVEGVNVLVTPALTPAGNSCINDTLVELEP
jgi:anaerobic selenocysteine-containing dehydrogenase